MDSKEIAKRIGTLSKFELIVNDFSTGLRGSPERPRIEFNHTSYPGVEAHLFTIADASSWQPELTDANDVVLLGSINESERERSWVKLLSILSDVMSRLEHYRQGLKHGILPSSNWIFHELTWYRMNWERHPPELQSTESFLYTVDESIKPHIKELNDLGFSTTQSCSGLAKDHVDRKPYQPYVMFDERIYPRSSAHLFTLADITGWIPSYGPHNFDVEFRLTNSEDAERFWDNLVSNAKVMASLIHNYRTEFSIFPDSLKGTL
ncbi:MAG: hypothetical protein ACFFE6_08580 [Candidatus Thorarchaeota archaeon]